MAEVPDSKSGTRKPFKPRLLLRAETAEIQPERASTNRDARSHPPEPPLGSQSEIPAALGDKHADGIRVIDGFEQSAVRGGRDLREGRRPSAPQ